MTAQATQTAKTAPKPSQKTHGMSPRGQLHPQMICLMQEELEVSADRPGAQPRKQAYQIQPTFTRKGHDPSFRDTPPSSEFFLMPFSLIS